MAMPISTVKILLLGNTNAGKSSLILQFHNLQFDSHIKHTIGVDFICKTVTVDGNQINIQIWDTAGQERFHSVTQSFYRRANAVMLVYDINNPNSFGDIENIWLKNIKKKYEMPKVLVGNKTDLLRHVSETAGKLASSHDMAFFETSAKNDTNVEEPFMHLIRQVLIEVPYKDDNTLEIKNLDNAKKALLKDKRKQIWTKNWLKFWSCFEKE